eukprot:TRINITY_DN4423_c0_g1_i4.p1 TRINITY_DN4423_c0_g1~~TRINITY_DN4423_c0_g1_i4.p1  ORF type:complete len:164 (-),score=13.93 TRINITY_DN4423_c0_g1_i4:36-467(-)
MSSLSVAQIKERSIPLFKRYPVIERVELWGPFAQNEQTDSTEKIDFLVDYNMDCTMDDLSGLEIDLEKEFNYPVLLTSRKHVKPAASPSPSAPAPPWDPSSPYSCTPCTLPTYSAPHKHHTPSTSQPFLISQLTSKNTQFMNI